MYPDNFITTAATVGIVTNIVSKQAERHASPVTVWSKFMLKEVKKREQKEAKHPLVLTLST